MLYRKPNVFDEIVKIFDYRGLSLLFLHSKFVKAFKIELCRECEKILAVLRGECSIANFNLSERDILYLPKEIENIDANCFRESVIYIAQVKASRTFSPYVKRFNEAKKTVIDDAKSRRIRYTLISEEDPGEKFIVGYTFLEPGSWGSYPPHKHDDMYEIFIYFDLDPFFGIQTIFDESNEQAYIVRDYDVVLVTGGYHPNVSPPARGMKYLWIMVAKNGVKSHKVEIHPLYTTQ